MENKKMENKKEVRKERVIKLNINYLDLIKDISLNKEILNNKEKVIIKYENSLNLVFNNIERVNNRVNRKELKEVKENYLKEINLSNLDFNNISKKLLDFNKKRNNNFISIKI